MTLLIAVCVGVLFAVSVYLMLSRDLKTVAMGVFLVSHAVHLAILSMSGQPLVPTAEGQPPLVLGAPITDGDKPMADPLPQALILTSIVISFAVMAFLLTLLVVTHRRVGTLDVRALAGKGGVTRPRLEAPGAGAG